MLRKSNATADTAYSLREEYDRMVDSIRTRATERHDALHARMAALEQEDVAMENLLADID
jgi:hypothetical protein